ncbi:MAG: acetyl-CoA carboxylase biotin carboxyl carrier protein subunit, partial [Bacteroidales bacterium]
IVKTEGFEVKSPLPGDIIQIFVKEGDVVKLGDKLLVYEAMKMQNTILAERDGIIKNLKVQQGDTVLQDETLMEIEAKVTA